jgi:hypothetical protein
MKTDRKLTQTWPADPVRLPAAGIPVGALFGVALAILTTLNLPAQSPGFHTSHIGSDGVIQVDSHVTYYDGSDGTLFTAVPLPAGASALQFRATGAAITDGSDGLASSDGLYANGQTPYNFTATKFGGTFSGVPVGATTGVDPALFGVFFSYTFSGTPSDSINYRSDSGLIPDPRTLLSYSPSLNQPFYIGDGYTSNNVFVSASDTYILPGVIQTFTIPAGATHLLLGIGADVRLSDNQNAANNPSAFQAHVFDNSSSPPQIVTIFGGDQFAYEGLPWSLTALVGGSTPLSYQWSRNGTNLTDQVRIFGAQSNVLTFTNVLATDAGAYQLTVSNALGVASTNVSLTVLPLAVLTTNTYASAVINTSNLLGYWRFDPFFQTNSCVNGYTGTLHGNSQIGPEGSGCPLSSDAGNQALLLDGNSAYLTTSLAGQIGNQGTFLAWVYLTEQPSTSGHIFSIVSQSQSGNDFDFQIETDNHAKFYAGGVTVYGQALPLNQWHFLAATLASDSTRNIYLDGQLVASAAGGGHSTNNNPVWIGNNQVFGPRYFQGRIDEVAIFNRALTAAEIGALYSTALDLPPMNITSLNTNEIQIVGFFQSGRLTWANCLPGTTCAVQSATSLAAADFTNVPGLGNIPVTNTLMTLNVPLTSDPVRFFRISQQINLSLGLVAYYTFEGNVNDLSGNTNNAAVTNNVTFVPGISGLAASFDGNSSYIQVNESPSLMLAGPMSISAWVNPSAEGSLNCIVDKDFGFIGYNFYLQNGGVQMRISSTQGTATVTAGNVPLNTWSHVAGVYTGSQILVYLNGTLVGQTPVSTGLSNFSKNLYIGMWGPPGSGRFFQGQMDNVRIYNRPLYAAEVHALATSHQ